MTSHDTFATLYVVIGVLLASAPAAWLALVRNAKMPVIVGPMLKSAILGASCLIWLIATCALDGLPIAGGSLAVAATVAAGARTKSRLWTFVLTLALVGCSATLLWWKAIPGFPVISSQTLVLTFVIVLAICFLDWIPLNIRRAGKLGVLCGIVLLVVQHSLNTSAFFNDTVFEATRHHWGAYIGPSETLLSGARIFYDIPAQYGLGPTLLIALACRDDCWTGMYWVTTVASMIYGFLMVAAAAVVLRRVDSLCFYVLALLAVGVSCMVWNTYPPLVSGAGSFPSTGALRFAPLAALLLFALGRETRPANSRPSRVYGHALWCLGALWSPEAAFYSSFVWWPYLLWRAAKAPGDPIRKVTWTGIEIAAVGMTLLLMFLAGYHLLYGVSPSLFVYLAYVTNLIGPEPANLKGAIWFYGVVMVIGLVAAAKLIANRKADAEFGSLYVCILAGYAVFNLLCRAQC